MYWLCELLFDSVFKFVASAVLNHLAATIVKQSNNMQAPQNMETPGNMQATQRLLTKTMPKPETRAQHRNFQKPEHAKHIYTQHPPWNTQGPNT
jgi:hypothetical protein